ncbi:MAG: NrsF family protein [Thermomonas sp.]
MTDTTRMIEQLSARAAPVRRMWSPMRRTLAWLLAASLVMAGMVLTHAQGADVARVLASPDATREWLAALLTGVLASYAVFQVSVPGRDPRWAWLPVPAALFWLASLGLGCMNEVARDGLAALAFRPGPMECLRAISMTSIPLGLVLLLMVRHAGVVRPRPTALLAMLSAAALSSSTVSLIHDGGESSLMVLIWHIGAVALLSLASLLLARRMFAWIGYSRHA